MSGPTSNIRALPSSAGKVPPQNLDAERAVLATLLNGKHLDAVRALVAADDFFPSAHQTIFRAVFAVHDAGKPVDVITVCHHLRDAGLLDQLNMGPDCRGSGLVVDVADKTPAVHNVEAHARIVADLARRWRLIRECQRIAAEGYGDVADGWIETSTAAVASISSAAPSTKFSVMDASTIFAPLIVPPDVITGCVRASSITLLAGFGSGSKTWQGLDANVSVALGQPWLGRFQTVQGPTAFVDFESGAYETCRRIQANARARGYETVRDVGVVSMPGIYLGDVAFLRAMEELATSRSLIVVDSLRAASLVDENDSRIRLGLDQLRAVAEKTRCAFIVLVHAKKSSGSVTQIDERELLRGSSAVFDAADVVFVSTYKKDEERFDVVQAKARHGRKVDPFSVRLIDERGGVTVLASDTPEAERAPTQNETFQAAVERVRQVLKSDPGCGVTTLRAKVGGKAVLCDGALDWLISRGEVVDLEEKKGKRTDHHFRLVSEVRQ